VTKRLVIAEKPSVASDIANALGPFESHDKGAWYETEDFLVSYAVGHLLELDDPAKYNKELKGWSLKKLPIIPEEFSYSPRDGSAQKRLAVLRKLAKRKDCSGLVNACDAGREGEHIFRTVAGYLGGDHAVERLWLSSMTKGAIQKGFAALQPGADFENLADAACSRAEADWLIGINTTRALTIRLKSLRYDGAWTVGRVQTPTLTMLVDRELSIYAHRPRDYWQVLTTFNAGDHQYDGIWFDPKFDRANSPSDAAADRLFDREQVDAIAAALAENPSASAEETRAERSERPPLPFDLTSLQRAANNRFGYSAKRTLDAAQGLYERHKLLSYPRTDSRHLPQDQSAPVHSIIEALVRTERFGSAARGIGADGMQNVGRVFDDAKVSDHYAIVPVGIPSPNQLSGMDAKIYELVTAQFLAAFMKPAKWAEVKRRTTIETTVGPAVFRSNGRVLQYPGWQAVFGREAGHGSDLAHLGQPQVSVVEHNVEAKETQAPARFTEAGVLHRMETCGKEVEDAELSEALRERGLGTPATRADTIERLITRKYVSREGKGLRATAKALRLIEVLRAAGAPVLTSAELTGDLEHSLRRVEGGDRSRSDFMDSMREHTIELTGALVDMDFDDLYGAESIGHCPGAPEATVKETAWGYEATCENGDAFFIWKDFRGHILLPTTMSALLAETGGGVGPVTLFPDTGPGYDAKIKLVRLDDETYGKIPVGKRTPSRWQLRLLDEEGNVVAPKTTVDEEAGETLCKCPTFDDVPIVITDLRYVDETSVGQAGKPRAALPLEVCKRAMTTDEARAFFTEGKTPQLEGFISKRGRPFKATLVLKPNGRHGFEFPPRAPRPPKGAKKAEETGEKKPEETSEKKPEETVEA
jgi:DNA topoisomerase-3